MPQQGPPPSIVTLVETPTEQTSFADVLMAAVGITGVLVLVAVVLGLVTAYGLIKWHQRHRPEDDHLPSIVTPGQSANGAMRR
jgi:hypothetical protein